MQTSPQQIEAINSLPADKRYRHFVKQVADSQNVWSLYEEGWAISVDENGTRLLRVWPAKEYAELLKTDEWENYETRSIPLDEFLGELLPDLGEMKLLISVASLPQGEGIVVTPTQLASDIGLELENY